MWVKKCVKIHEMLFKNWKWLFENTNQTRPSVSNNMTKRRMQRSLIGNSIDGCLGVRESPSKIELRKPTSYANWTARLAARVSRTTTDYSIGILSVIAAKTSPLSFRTTTPIPSTLISSNIAPIIIYIFRTWIWWLPRRFFSSSSSSLGLAETTSLILNLFSSSPNCPTSHGKELRIKIRAEVTLCLNKILTPPMS